MSDISLIAAATSAVRDWQRAVAGYTRLVEVVSPADGELAELPMLEFVAADVNNMPTKIIVDPNRLDATQQRSLAVLLLPLLAEDYFACVPRVIEAFTALRRQASATPDSMSGATPTTSPTTAGGRGS